MTVDSLLEQKPTGKIYHYADANATLGIITNQTIWASSIRHLNDSSEYQRAVQVLTDFFPSNEHQEGIPPTVPDDSSTVEKSGYKKSRFRDSLIKFMSAPPLAFVASFSERADRLSQWRGYCPNGDGYSLGFDASSLKCPFGMQLVKCVYSHERAIELCAALLESWPDKPSNDADGFVETLFTIMKVMASIKDPGFEEEQEWRLVSVSLTDPHFRAGRHGIVPYVEIPYGAPDQLQLTDVWLGPNSDMMAAKRALERLLDVRGHKEIQLHLSSIPLRK